MLKTHILAVNERFVCKVQASMYACMCMYAWFTQALTVFRCLRMVISLSFKYASIIRSRFISAIIFGISNRT